MEHVVRVSCFSKLENIDFYFLLAISSQIVYATEDVHDDHPMPLEDFMNQIKSHWIERVTFTRNSKPFSIKASSLPPIIAPKLAGPVIWNSELKKKSAYLGDGQNKVKGKLHFYVVWPILMAFSFFL